MQIGKRTHNIGAKLEIVSISRDILHGWKHDACAVEEDVQLTFFPVHQNNYTMLFIVKYSPGPVSMII